LLFTLFFLVQETKAASWVQLHDNTEAGAPSPVRGEFTANTWKNSIYIYGGCDINFENWMNDTWVFPIEETNENSGNVTAYRLETTGQAPPGTCGHGAVVLGDRLYVYGGNGPHGATDTLHFLDLNTNKWTVVERDVHNKNQIWPPSRALIQHAMTKSGPNKFIIVSGTSANPKDDDSAYEISVKDNVWRKISQGMAGHQQVGGSSAVSINEMIYVMGGYENRSVIEDLYYLNIGKEENFNVVESKDGDTPGPLSFQGALVFDKYMVVYGGFSLDAINGDVWVFTSPDGKNGSWCKLRTTSTQPLPHFAGGWVSINSSLYAFGGRINPSGYHEKLTSDLWRLDDIKATIKAECNFL
jgi:hypothetical protein